MNPAGKLCTALVVLLVLGQAPKLSARTLPQVKVAVVLDHTDEHVSLNHTGTSQASDFSLTLVPVHIKNSSFAEASGRFCTDILQNGTSVVVLHTQTPKLAHLFAALSSEFRIPVIGDTSQDPLQPQQSQYSTLVQTKPPDTDQFAAVLAFLRYIGRNSNLIVIVSDNVIKNTATEFFSSEGATFSVTIIKVDASHSNHNQIRKALLSIKTSNAHSVFLHCEENVAHPLLWLAKDFGIINDEYTWILSDTTVNSVLELFTIPSDIYGLRINVPARVTQLGHSVRLIQRTFQAMSVESREQYLGRRIDCLSGSPWSVGQKLHRKLLETWQFNTDAENEWNTYSCEILFLQGQVSDYAKVWIPVGVWQNGAFRLHSRSPPRGEGDRGSSVMLRAAVVEYPPLTMQVPYDPRVGCRKGLRCVRYGSKLENFTTHCCFGLAIDVLKYTSTELQFEPFVYFARDGNYGAKNSTTGEWNGIVADLLGGQADISIDLMGNEARSKVIDFSMRWTPAGLALLVLVGEKQTEDIDFSFSRPFTIGLWGAMIAVVNIYLFCMWSADRSSPYGHKQTKSASEDNRFDLVESMWYSWGVCFDNQFVDVRPKSLGGRMMASFLAMFSLLCLTSYTANLTAHLVSDDTKPEITGIRDPKITAPGSHITYGVVKSSYVDSYFEHNQDPTMRKMFRRMRDRDHLVSNFTDGVERVKQRQMDIFISEVLSLDYEVAKQKTKGYPRLQVVGAAASFAESGYAYAFRKNSPWKPKFDVVINRLKAENLPSQLYKKWVSSGRSVSEEHHERLDTHSLSGLFFLGSSLVVASFIFLFFENRLYSAGFIYKDMQATETYKKGKRKFSTEVRKKLLLKRSKRQEEEKEETTELYPDISNYLHDRRRSNVMLTSMYNPKSTRSKYDLSPQTETTAV